MTALLVIALSSYALGSWLLGLLKIQAASAAESLLFRIGAGLALWSLLLFVLGEFGLFYSPLLIVLSVIIALPAPFLLYREFRRCPVSRPAFSLTSKICLVAIGTILSLTFLACFAPVVGGIANDALCTHLSIPGEWLRHHGIVELPFSTSYMAGNAHLHFLLASCFDPQSGPCLLSWLSFVLCLAAVWILSRQFLGHDHALLAVLITAVNPLVFRGAHIAFVDLQSALFIMLPICALVSYKKEKKWQWLVLSGLFMGVGCGIKATNIIYSAVIIVAGVVAMFLRTRRAGETVRAALLLCAATAIFALPWPVRDLLYTGSPTFPPPLALYHAGKLAPLLGGPAPYSYAEIKGFYDYCLSRYGDYKRGPAALLRFPWDITMRPARFQIGDSIGTLLLSFVPLALLFIPLPGAALFLLGFAVGAGFLIYIVVLPEARYYIAAIMALGPVAAYGVSKLDKYKAARIAAYLVIGINVLFSLGVAFRITARPVLAAISAPAREEYKKAGIPYYEAFEYLRKNRIDTVFVAAPDRIFYYLDGVYEVDTALHHADSSYAGRVVLETDYSQILGRDTGIINPARPGAFASKPLPDNTQLLFEGPDARVYKFTFDNK
ncbi:MAG: glycosyltransferase family 39 protein [Chitinispirillaceae bacterium]|nr:glycosyltransferase family 39 protein [Chitinispirillaceae bacterium]